MVGNYGVSWDERLGGWSINADSDGHRQEITGLDGHALMHLAVMMVQTVATDGTTWPRGVSDDPVETLANEVLRQVLEGQAHQALAADDDGRFHDRMSGVAEVLDAIHGDLFLAVQRLAEVHDQIMDGD